MNKQTTEAPEEVAVDNDATNDNSRKIPVWFRCLGAMAFTVSLATLVGYSVYVIGTSHWVEYAGLGKKCLVFVALFTTLGYTGFVVARNSHFLPANDRRDGRKTGAFLFMLALLVQVLPGIMIGVGFLIESAATAIIGFMAIAVTAVIGFFALALGFCALVTGFSPSDQTVEGLIRSVKNVPTDPSGYRDP